MSEMINPYSINGSEIEVKELSAGADAIRKELAFPEDALPKEMYTYCKAIAENLCVDIAMVATAMLTILGVVCQHCTVEVKEGWEEPVSLFTAILAEPGEKKSPVCRKLMKPIDEFVRQFNKYWYENTVGERGEILKYEVKAREKEVEIGLNDFSIKVNQMTVIRKVEAGKIAVYLNPLRLYEDDATPESISRLMGENNGKAAIIATEGGIIDVIGGRKYSSTISSDIFNKGYSGEPITVTRADRKKDITIERASMSMLLMVQPIAFQRILQNQSLVHNGFLDRFLLVSPTSRASEARFDTPLIDKKLDKKYNDIIWCILEHRFGIDRYTKDENQVRLVIDDIEQDTFAEFYDANSAEISESADLKGWKSKCSGMVARIAGILGMYRLYSSYVAENGRLEYSPINPDEEEDTDITTSTAYIGLEEVECAIKLIRWYEMHTRYVRCGTIDGGDVTLAGNLLKKIEARISKLKLYDEPVEEQYITIRELMQHCKTKDTDTRDKMMVPIRTLIEHGYLAEPLEVDSDTGEVRRKYDGSKDLREVYVSPFLIDTSKHIGR